LGEELLVLGSSFSRGLGLVDLGPLEAGGLFVCIFGVGVTMAATSMCMMCGGAAARGDNNSMAEKLLDSDASA